MFKHGLEKECVGQKLRSKKGNTSVTKTVDLIFKSVNLVKATVSSKFVTLLDAEPTHPNIIGRTWVDIAQPVFCQLSKFQYFIFCGLCLVFSVIFTLLLSLKILCVEHFLMLQFKRFCP